MKALSKQTRSIKPAEVEKNWHIIDADGLVVGRLAADGGDEGLGFLFADQAAQGRDRSEEVGDLAEGAEAAQALEVGDGQGHLGLVVVVGVVLGVAGVQLGGPALVGVRLDGQRLVDGQHLEEKR